MKRAFWFLLAGFLTISIFWGLADALYYANVRGNYARGCWELLVAAFSAPVAAMAYAKAKR